jgi:hypothetical protein
MHWVFGFDAKKPYICEENHGFIPTAIMLYSSQQLSSRMREPQLFPADALGFWL